MFLQTQRESKGIAPTHSQPRRYKGVDVQHLPWPHYYPHRPSSYCIGGWVGLGAVVDKQGKSRPHGDSIPVSSNP